MNIVLPNGRAAEILLVEDNESDVLLTREGFRRANCDVRLHHVDHGELALAFLHKEGEFSAAPTPDIVLLDLNMPVMDGRELLRELVQDPQLQHLPVVVLTTSADQRDIRLMYQLRCNGYVIKPVDFDAFVVAIQGIANFWFSTVALPSQRG